MKMRLGSVLASSLAVALAGPVGADAATHHAAAHRHRAHGAGAGPSGSTGSTGTPLTGTTLSSATAAALAAVPGTVSSATTETDGAGAYAVVVTKSDGSRVRVIESASFAVLSTAATNCR